MAGRVFHDDFESYAVGTLPFTNFVQDVGAGAPQVVSSSTDGVLGPRGGSRMLRTNHTGSVYTSADTPTLAYTNEIFYRFYLRPDENHAGEPYPGIGTKYLRFYLQSGRYWIDKFIVHHHSGTGFTNSGQYGLDTDDQNTYYGGSDTTDSSDHWNKVEMYFNTTTGACKIWQDGTLVTSVTGRTLNGLQASPIHLVSNSDALGDSTNYMYWDDIEVFTDAGTGGTGSMSDATITQSGADTTPPAAPTGVTIS